MGIALGLAAALSWGFSDYCATLASRRTGAVRTVLGFHLAAIVALAVAVAATGALDGVTGKQVLVLAGVGALGWVSYLGFYRALAIGPISIVSPIVSGYAVVAVILAVLLLGERLGGGEVAAVLVVFAGVALASVDLRMLRVTGAHAASRDPARRPDDVRDRRVRVRGQLLQRRARLARADLPRAGCSRAR